MIRRCGLLLLCSVLLATPAAQAGPETDLKALQDFYQKRFPDVPLAAHKDGVYAIDAGARDQWLELEEFPPYEIAIDDGEQHYKTPFANGTSYLDCFGSAAIKHHYPKYDEASDAVVTLEIAINQCREANAESPLPYESAELAELVAYLAYQSRGQTVAAATPTSPGELAAYEAGKRFYQSRRGQLNFACSTCHVQLVGNRLRAEVLSGSLGHVTHWPVYRLKWQEVGILHRRFQECNDQVGAESFPLQSEAYRNLEYFLTYMSNGTEWNGPASRK